MPEPARTALRVLGLALLVLSLTCLVLIFYPGPTRVAEALGQTCANDRHGSTYQCSWLDAADLLWTGVWLSLVLGAVLRIATRPAGRAPRTIDLRRISRKFGS